MPRPPKRRRAARPPHPYTGPSSTTFFAPRKDGPTSLSHLEPASLKVLHQGRTVAPLQLRRPRRRRRHLRSTPRLLRVGGAASCESPSRPVISRCVRGGSPASRRPALSSISALVRGLAPTANQIERGFNKPPSRARTGVEKARSHLARRRLPTRYLAKRSSWLPKHDDLRPARSTLPTKGSRRAAHDRIASPATVQANYDFRASRRDEKLAVCASLAHLSTPFCQPRPSNTQARRPQRSCAAKSGLDMEASRSPA